MNETTDPTGQQRTVPQVGSSYEAPSARRGHGRVRAFLALGSVIGVGAVLTTAAFSDRADVATEFKTGSLDITIDDGEQGNPTAYSVSFDGADEMMPGETVYRSLMVNNEGSMVAYVSMDASVEPDDETDADENLAEALVLSVGVLGELDDCDSEFEFNDALIDEDSLDGASIDALNDDGIAADGNVNLCFAVSLPDDDNDDTNGGSVSAQFTFNASSEKPEP